jgi:hypothetical protein
VIGETLRSTGIAVCTTNENIMLCRCVRVEVALTPGGAHEVVRQLQARFAEITGTSTDLTIGDFLAKLDSSPNAWWSRRLSRSRSMSRA